MSLFDKISAHLALSSQQRNLLRTNLLSPAYRALVEASWNTLPKPLARELATLRPGDLDTPLYIRDLEKDCLRTPLEWIACYDPHLMPIAVAAGAKINTARAPLLAAVKTGFCDLATRLLSQGADPDCQRVHVFCTETPLIVALEREDRNMVDLLLRSGANPNAFNGDPHRPCPLVVALGCEDISFANLLLAYGADWRLCDLRRVAKLPLDKFAWFAEFSGYCVQSLAPEGESLPEIAQEMLRTHRGEDYAAKVALLNELH